MFGDSAIPAVHLQWPSRICELRFDDRNGWLERGIPLTELYQFTKLIRSKNAGPFELTFDIMFKNTESFRTVLESGRLTTELFSRLYAVPVNQVRLFVLEPLLTIKVTIPRPIPSGDLEDGDVYGGQFHGPLIQLAID